MQRKLAASFMLVAALTGLAVLSTRWLETWLGAWAVALTMCLIVFAALTGAVLLARRLSAPLTTLARAARQMEEGDLTVDVPRSRSGLGADEIDHLSGSFGAMRDVLVRALGELKGTSDQMNASARDLSGNASALSSLTEEISRTARKLAGGAERTVERIGQTQAVTADVAHSADEIGRAAEDALHMTRSTGDDARRGRELAERADRELEHIGEQVRRMIEAVEGFRDRALSINKMVDMISTIAEQTHMVALNAAIEAARAGEHGEGFAVVAEEVRQLSERAGRYAEQITGFADAINAGSQTVIRSMDETSRAARTGRDVVGGASESLRMIAGGVLPLVERMAEIERLAREQRDGMEALVQSIDEIARIARDGAAGIEEASTATTRQNRSMEAMAEAASGLAGTSERLREICAVFRVAPER
jgi:methyl-accepting chemotaxis protein